MKTINLLYIHGLNSRGSTSTTSKKLKSLFRGTNVIVHSPDIDPNPDVSIPFLKDYISKNEIKIIVATSLGGFYALKLKNYGAFTIICNPCVYPSKFIHKLGSSKSIADKYEKYEFDILDFDSETKSSFIGIFGDRDDMFSYKNEISNSGVKVITTNDYHRISNITVTNVIYPIINDYILNDYIPKNIKSFGDSFIVI